MTRIPFVDHTEAMIELRCGSDQIQTEEQSQKKETMNPLNFDAQSAIYLNQLANRRRCPVKPATLKAYNSYMANWILPLIGDRSLETFGNGAMKEFVKRLVASKLGPKTVGEIVTLVKQILASAVTEDGNQLYPRQWNHKFIDLPPKDRTRPPRMTDEQLERALCGRHGAFYALLAGTGLRVAEALAVRWGDTPNVTSLDSERPIIFVRSQIGLGREEYSPKTKAGEREVDLYPELWEFLRNVSNQVSGDFVIRNRKGGPMWQQTLHASLKALGIAGFHAFRRHRITRLREIGVPEDIIRFWVGHEGNETEGFRQSTTDRYSKLSENVDLRRDWVLRAGLGFALPQICKLGPPASTSSKASNASQASTPAASPAPTYVAEDSDLDDFFHSTPSPQLEHEEV